MGQTCDDFLQQPFKLPAFVRRERAQELEERVRSGGEDAVVDGVARLGEVQGVSAAVAACSAFEQVRRAEAFDDRDGVKPTHMLALLTGPPEVIAVTPLGGVGLPPNGA